MGVLADNREALRSAMFNLSQTSEPLRGILLYDHTAVVPPNYDEQERSVIWVRSSINPTEIGEQFMGGGYTQNANLRFEIGSPREASARRDAIADALIERFSASRIGTMDVEHLSERDEPDQTAARTWYETDVVLSCSWDED